MSGVDICLAKTDMIIEFVRAYLGMAETPAFNQVTELLRELRLLLEQARVPVGTDYDSDEASDLEFREVPEDGATRKTMAQVVGALNTYSTCLMDLLPSMEETLYYVTYIKLPKQHSLPARFKASRLAHTYVRGISEQFEMADSRLWKGWAKPICNDVSHCSSERSICKT